MIRVEITGKYVRTLFDSSANGKTNGTSAYRVAKYSTPDISVLPEELQKTFAGKKRAEFVAFGADLPLEPEVEYSMIGYFIYSRRQKDWQLKVISYGLCETNTASQAKAFLSNLNIPGLSFILIGRCADTFGNSLLSVIANTPERLLEVQGITEEMKDSIAEEYHKHFDLHNLSKFLMPVNISVEKANRLLTKNGSSVVKNIKTNPFCAYGARGFDFAACSSIAEHYGIKVRLATKISCAIHNALQDCYRLGDLFMTEQALVASARRLLDQYDIDAKEDDIHCILRQLETIGKVVRRGSDAIFLPEADRAEKILAEKIVAMNRFFDHLPKVPDDVQEVAITEAVKTLAFTPAEMQVEAVVKCLNSGVSVITGGPGTGKSTVLDLVIKAYSHIHKNPSIALLAPSGKAARRMAECTHRDAYTVHKYLGAGGEIDNNPDTDFTPMFHADLVIVDESSMLDLFVACALFKALPETTKVILVGDVNQLPSVGPGNVLRSVIASKCISTTELNVIHRQGGTSPIVINSHRINSGKIKLEWCADFRFVETTSEDETREKCEEFYLKEKDRVGIDNVAALTPYRTDKKKYSSTVMAPELQNIVNPRRGEMPIIKVLGKEFRENDRVMQMRNKGDLNNGDIGIVKKVVPQIANKDGASEYMIVEFNGKEHRIEGEDLEFIESSLCYTIHRSQGSEYKSVIIPLFEEKPEKGGFISRNLLYTAVTRAKERVIIVGNSKTFQNAVQRSIVAPRNTYLGKRIQELFEEA